MTVLTTTAKAGPYAGAGTTGPFTVPFRFLDASHLRVIKNVAGIESVLVLTTDYTVSGVGASSGSVTLTAALPVGQTLTVVRNVPATQDADYVPGDAFPAESHEEALDKLTMLVQQNVEELNRAAKLPASSTTDADALSAALLRVDANEANINAVAGNEANINAAVANATNINTVAGISGNVTTVAGIAANVTTVAGNDANVTTVAGSIANVNTVAGSIANVNAVGTNIANVNAVNANETNINTVAGINANVTTVAGISAQVTTVAASNVAVQTVATNIASVGAVALIDADVSTVAGIAANVTAVAGNETNVTAVAGNATNINAVAGNATNINAVAGNATNINTVASVNADVTAVAGVSADIPIVAANVADIQNFADVYQGAKSSAPALRNDGSALQIGDLYFDTVLDEMRVYSASGWKSAGSTVNGTAIRQSFIATAGQTTFAVVGGYDAGFADVYLNGVKMVNGTDVTVTSGTDVVLAVGAAAGDSVDVIAYGSFLVANTYTQAQADALLAAKASLTGAETLTNKTIQSSTIQGGALTLSTAVTASGTAVDFTGIPSWVKRVTVMFSGLSTNGTSIPLIQLGDAGGIENTGYSATAVGISGSGTSANTYTAGFGLIAASHLASNTYFGFVQFDLLSSNNWVAVGNLAIPAVSGVMIAGGKTLSDTLTQVRVTTTNGTDTFDAGTINIMYEG